MQAASYPRFQCRPVSRDALTDRNVLCRRHESVAVDWLGQAWAFEFGPADAGLPMRHWLQLDWGGACAYAGLPDSAVDAIAAHVSGSDALAGLPEEIALAVLEVGLAGLLRAAEGATRKNVRVNALLSQRPAQAALEPLGWHASPQDGSRISGELLLDDAARRFLASALREVPCRPDASPEWDRLPVPLRLAAGWVDLTQRAVASLAPHDVVMLDECFIAAGDTLLAQVGPALGFRCALKGVNMEVLENVQEVMADADDRLGADSHGLVEDVPVRLTFDMGERAVSFGDLRTLQPGFIFNLGRDPRNTISIRANGHMIGEGELVDIEGRIGVSIVRLRAAA